MDGYERSGVYLEILQDLLFGEREEITGFNPCSIEYDATERSEFLRFFENGCECFRVGDIYAPDFDFDCLVGRIGSFEDGISVFG